MYPCDGWRFSEGRRRAATNALLLGAISAALCCAHADETVAALPAGVKPLWDLGKAYHETTPTRERICINGLWRWQPAAGDLKNPQPPAGGWGYFKVPGCWPGSSDYLQKDSQTLFAHSSWKSQRLTAVTAAWYEREISVPRESTGRRIVLVAEYVNSYAAVFLDGKAAGEVRFPGGELELTSACRPGETQRLSLLVAALPQSAVMLSLADTATSRQVRGTVPRRGLCGDVYLASTPMGARIDDFAVTTSVRKTEISIDAGLRGLAPDSRYSLRATITDHGRHVAEFTGNLFQASDVEHGRASLTAHWKPDRLWDIDQPGNAFSVSLSLLDAAGRVLDVSVPVQTGFREFWIDGRDFYLNGTRIFLSSVPLDNAQASAATAGYDATRETLERLKSFGINMVYTHNYGCQPGSHLGFTEILRAADDVGMLVSFSQPHFGHYDWKRPDADTNNGYERHAEFYVRMARNHPSIVFYSMSHNGTGYSEDMNPDLIDGVQDPREPWAQNNAKLALRAEAIVRRFDPSRIVYHHSSGNLGSMHTANFYPNFVPIQELSDWFEHWATKGAKPVFLCEYGAPFTWDWAMYRGWYKGQRTFGSARVPWEFCLAEWDAQFLGDRAYQLTAMEQANLRWESRQFRAGNLWHRWDYPHQLGSPVFDDRHEVMAMYLTDNFRAFRTWDVSATSPWEFGHFWRLRAGVDKRRRAIPVDWEHLQRPGFSADFIDGPFERMDMAYERSDWAPTKDGEALLRNNRPLLGYIGGKPARFTSREHNYSQGETVEKQIIVLNNSRRPVSCVCVTSLGGFVNRGQATVETGQQLRMPFTPPNALPPGTHEMQTSISFSTRETQHDSMTIHVLPRPPALDLHTSIALFDPKGETAGLLDRLGVNYEAIGAGADLSRFELLIVGKLALTVDQPAPDIGRVRAGLKVVVFEQGSRALEQRLGFRVQEYGLRQVFPRVPEHPLLAGIGAEHLRDWRGATTTVAPRLRYEMRARYGPTIQWCGIPVTRVWRSGNQGSVASVLIEKPARGDFLPVVDGGFSLQYSPLLEFREGRGLVIFCQFDVTGRSESDPAGELLTRHILRYASPWKPGPSRKVRYSGDQGGLRHLEMAGFNPVGFAKGDKPATDEVLVIGPGGGKWLAASAPAIADWLKSGGHLLAIGLDQDEINAFLPINVRTQRAEHIWARFDPARWPSPLVGIGPADVHNRDPREIPLITAGATAIGDGVLARVDGLNVVFCQLVPWEFSDPGKLNIKRTYRHISFLLSRLLANMGAAASTPILDRFHAPVTGARPERRWLDGLYLDQPEEWDDPYRFFRW
jgi:beta-galactosidase